MAQRDASVSRPARRPTVANLMGEALAYVWKAPATATPAAPHVRDASNTQRLLGAFFIASIPCFGIGMWNLGEQTHFAMQQIGMEAAPGWRGALLGALGVDYDSTDVLGCVLHGLTYFLPVFVVAVVTGLVWEALFARLRQRPPQEGVLAVAWLFALILPATIPLYQVALGMTFGYVVGKAIFGGNGRYLVNPSVLGLVFLTFAYSNVLFGVGTWIPVPGYEEPTTIELAVAEGGVNALTAVNYTWWQLFLGNQPGPMGVTSILGCLLGAGYLMVRGAASWRIMAGSLLGLLLGVGFVHAIAPPGEPMFAVPWYWHFVIGGWAFGTVFLATDPVPAAITRPGRWGFGILVGLLTIIVRVTNPAYYEGVLFAILLASMFSPLIDHAVIARNVKRRRKRTASGS